MRYRLSHRFAPGWWGGVAFGGLRALRTPQFTPQRRQNRPGLVNWTFLGFSAVMIVAFLAVYWLPIVAMVAIFLVLRAFYLLLTDPTTRWWAQKRSLRPFFARPIRFRHLHVPSMVDNRSNRA